jgi:hypothetical protein
MADDLMHHLQRATAVRRALSNADLRIRRRQAVAGRAGSRQNRACPPKPQCRSPMVHPSQGVREGIAMSR